MDPSSQPSELEILRRRAAALESEKESIREHFELFGTRMEMVVHERNALRRKLQTVEKAFTCVAVAHEDALAVLREVIPEAVSGDTPPPAASDARFDQSLPNKRSRSARGPDGAE